MTSSLRITPIGIIEGSLSQTPLPLFFLGKASLLCGTNLNSLSTNIPRNFVVGEWIESVGLIEGARKEVWEQLENTGKNHFKILRDVLLI